MRKAVIVTRDLRDDRCHILVQKEALVLNEVTTDAAEIDRREKVLEVNVEDMAPVAMLVSVCDDRSLALEAMRYTVLPLLRIIYFINAVLKQAGNLLLHKFQLIGGGFDSSRPALTLGNIEDSILGCRLFVQDI